MVSGWRPGAKKRGAKHPVPVAGPAEMRAMRRGDAGFGVKPDGSTIVKPDGSTIAVAHTATVVPVAPVVDLPPLWFAAAADAATQTCAFITKQQTHPHPRQLTASHHAR